MSDRSSTRFDLSSPLNNKLTSNPQQIAPHKVHKRQKLTANPQRNLDMLRCCTACRRLCCPTKLQRNESVEFGGGASRGLRRLVSSTERRGTDLLETLSTVIAALCDYAVRFLRPLRWEHTAITFFLSCPFRLNLMWSIRSGAFHFVYSS